MSEESVQSSHIAAGKAAHCCTTVMPLDSAVLEAAHDKAVKASAGTANHQGESSAAPGQLHSLPPSFDPEEKQKPPAHPKGSRAEFIPSKAATPFIPASYDPTRGHRGAMPGSGSLHSTPEFYPPPGSQPWDPARLSPGVGMPPCSSSTEAMEATVSKKSSSSKLSKSSSEFIPNSLIPSTQMMASLQGGSPFPPYAGAQSGGGWSYAAGQPLSASTKPADLSPAHNLTAKPFFPVHSAPKPFLTPAGIPSYGPANPVLPAFPLPPPGLPLQPTHPFTYQPPHPGGMPPPPQQHPGGAAQMPMSSAMSTAGPRPTLPVPLPNGFPSSMAPGMFPMVFHSPGAVPIASPPGGLFGMPVHHPHAMTMTAPHPLHPHPAAMMPAPMVLPPPPHAQHPLGAVPPTAAPATATPSSPPLSVTVGTPSFAKRDQPKFSCVLLTGLPATGKTSVGRKVVQGLAQDGLGWHFFSGADAISKEKKSNWDTIKEVLDALSAHIDSLQKQQAEHKDVKGLVIDKNCKTIEEIYYISGLLQMKGVSFVGIVGLEAENDEVLVERLGGEPSQQKERLKYHRVIQASIVGLAKSSGMYHKVDATRTEEEVQTELRRQIMGCIANPPSRRLKAYNVDSKTCTIIEDYSTYHRVITKLHDCVPGLKLGEFPHAGDRDRIDRISLDFLNDKDRVEAIKKRYGVRRVVGGVRYMLYLLDGQLYLVPSSLRAVLMVPNAAWRGTMLSHLETVVLEGDLIRINSKSKEKFLAVEVHYWINKPPSGGVPTSVSAVPAFAPSRNLVEPRTSWRDRQKILETHMFPESKAEFPPDSDLLVVHHPTEDLHAAVKLLVDCKEYPCEGLLLQPLTGQMGDRAMEWREPSFITVCFRVGCRTEATPAPSPAVTPTMHSAKSAPSLSLSTTPTHPHNTLTYALEVYNKAEKRYEQFCGATLDVRQTMIQGCIVLCTMKNASQTQSKSQKYWSLRKIRLDLTRPAFKHDVEETLAEYVVPRAVFVDWLLKELDVWDPASNVPYTPPLFNPSPASINNVSHAHTPAAQLGPKPAPMASSPHPGNQLTQNAVHRNNASHRDPHLPSNTADSGVHHHGPPTSSVVARSSPAPHSQANLPSSIPNNSSGSGSRPPPHSSSTTAPPSKGATGTRLTGTLSGSDPKALEALARLVPGMHIVRTSAPSAALPAAPASTEANAVNQPHLRSKQNRLSPPSAAASRRGPRVSAGNPSALHKDVSQPFASTSLTPPQMEGSTTPSPSVPLPPRHNTASSSSAQASSVEGARPKSGIARPEPPPPPPECPDCKKPKTPEEMRYDRRSRKTLCYDCWYLKGHAYCCRCKEFSTGKRAPGTARREDFCCHKCVTPEDIAAAELRKKERQHRKAVQRNGGRPMEQRENSTAPSQPRAIDAATQSTSTAEKTERTSGSPSAGGEPPNATAQPAAPVKRESDEKTTAAVGEETEEKKKKKGMGCAPQ